MSGAVKVRTGRHKTLSAKIKFASLDPEILSLFDVGEGSSAAFTVRGSTQDRDGTTHAHVIKMRGFIETLDEGEWKDGEEAPTALDIAPDYYKREHDGVELIEADPVNMIFRVRGVDQLAQHRRNIGR